MLLSYINFIGIGVFSISGALLGVRKNLDFFGMWLLAEVTGLGGGIIRDVFLGITPPTSVQNWVPSVAATIGCILVFFFHPGVNKLYKFVRFFDALGAGVFSATAVITAFHHQASAFAAFVVALATAIGGGVIRDILVNEVPLLLSQDFYALPNMLGAVATICLAKIWGEGPAMVIGILLTISIRMVGVSKNWGLPKAPTEGVHLLYKFQKRKP